MLSWDAHRPPADWLATRARYYRINAIRTTGSLTACPLPHPHPRPPRPGLFDLGATLLLVEHLAAEVRQPGAE